MLAVIRFAAGVDGRVRKRPQHKRLESHTCALHRIWRWRCVRYPQNNWLKHLSNRDHLPCATHDFELQSGECHRKHGKRLAGIVRGCHTGAHLNIACQICHCQRNGCVSVAVANRTARAQRTGSLQDLIIHDGIALRSPAAENSRFQRHAESSSLRNPQKRRGQRNVQRRGSPQNRGLHCLWALVSGRREGRGNGTDSRPGQDRSSRDLAGGIRERRTSGAPAACRKCRSGSHAPDHCSSADWSHAIGRGHAHADRVRSFSSNRRRRIRALNQANGVGRSGAEGQHIPHGGRRSRRRISQGNSLVAVPERGRAHDDLICRDR